MQSCKKWSAQGKRYHFWMNGYIFISWLWKMMKVSLVRSKYFLCRICILFLFAVEAANNTVLSRHTNGSPVSLRGYSQSGDRKRTILWEFISESTCILSWKGFCIQMRDIVTGYYIMFWCRGVWLLQNYNWFPGSCF